VLKLKMKPKMLQLNVVWTQNKYRKKTEMVCVDELWEYETFGSRQTFKISVLRLFNCYDDDLNI
jgi:hypothetical protein